MLPIHVYNIFPLQAHQTKLDRIDRRRRKRKESKLRSRARRKAAKECLVTPTSTPTERCKPLILDSRESVAESTEPYEPRVGVDDPVNVPLNLDSRESAAESTVTDEPLTRSRVGVYVPVNVPLNLDSRESAAESTDDDEPLTRSRVRVGRRALIYDTVSNTVFTMYR